MGTWQWVVGFNPPSRFPQPHLLLRAEFMAQRPTSLPWGRGCVAQGTHSACWWGAFCSRPRNSAQPFGDDSCACSGPEVTSLARKLKVALGVQGLQVFSVGLIYPHGSWGLTYIHKVCESRVLSLTVFTPVATTRIQTSTVSIPPEVPPSALVIPKVDCHPDLSSQIGFACSWTLRINDVLKETPFCVCLASFTQMVSCRLSRLCLEQQWAVSHGMNLLLSEFHFLNSIVRIYPGIHATGMGLGWFPVWHCYE